MKKETKTVKCKDCLAVIDAKAKKCSKCGTDQRNWLNKHPVAGCFSIIIIAIMLLMVINPAGKIEESSTSGSGNSNSNNTNSSVTIDPVDKSKNKESGVPAEYKSALVQANTYANNMHMSKRGLYDQLVSEYGGKFSVEAAQYAIDNVKADWNANALKKARTYQDTMYLSPNAIRDQLTSDYGEKFTQEEASYAIQHLND